jgi:predicted transcriptional regulator
MTVMSRLGTKGLLAKSRLGNAFIYTPTYSREQFTRFSLKKVFSGLVRDFSTPAIQEFVESLGRHSPEELAELARAVKKMRRKTDA